MKNFDYTNKLVIVTGASSGIGYSTALFFANKCKYIALIGRSEQKLGELKLTISKKNPNVNYFVSDLSDLSSIPLLIQSIEKMFSKSIDVVINCAGYATLGKVENVPINEYINNFNVNFFSSVCITKELITNFKEKNSGQFIYINSGVGKRGLPGVSSYCSSKFALNGFCESLRVELLKYNIDVIVISPGLVSTNFHKNFKIFGKLKELFINGKYLSSDYVAKKIYLNAKKRKRYISLSFKSSLGVFLSNNFPKIMDIILSRKI